MEAERRATSPIRMGGGFVKRTVMEAYWCDVYGKGPFRAFVLIQIHMRGYHPGEGDS